MWGVGVCPIKAPKKSILMGVLMAFPPTAALLTTGKPSLCSFPAGDWSCEECGGHNFAKNSSCFKCRAPR